MARALLPLNVLNVPPKKIAIILGGGGFLGAVHPGVLQILEENNIPIHRVTGVSVGAVCGGSFVAHGCSVRAQIPIWDSLKDPSEVFEHQSIPYFVRKLAMPESVYRIVPLFRLIGKIDAEALVRQRHATEFIAVATEVPSKKVAYFSTRDPEIIETPLKILLAIAASCAFPGGFPAIPIHYRGALHCYIDGAFKRPLPLKKTVEDGYDTIIAVRCRSDKIKRPYPDVWIQAIAYGLDMEHENAEKDEISLIRRETDGINLFIIEPEYIPDTLTTVSFNYKNRDLQRVREAIKELALRTLAPLIDHFKNTSEH